MLAKILKLAIICFACTLSSSVYSQESDSLQCPTPLDAYERLIDSSFLYGNQGQYAEAEMCIRKALVAQPTHSLNAYLLNNLAGIQQLQGKYNEAILSYSAALERNQDEQTTRLNRARLYAATDQRKAAITDYSILIAQAPKNELYKYHRAMLYIWEGEYDLADLDLTAIIQNNNASLKARIGYALLETKRGHYTEAERLYDYLISKLPKAAEVYEGRARLYLLQGKRGFAIRDLEHAFELSTSNPTAALYRLKAEIATAMGEYKVAEEATKKAEELKGANI